MISFTFTHKDANKQVGYCLNILTYNRRTCISRHQIDIVSFGNQTTMLVMIRLWPITFGRVEASTNHEPSPLIRFVASFKYFRNIFLAKCTKFYSVGLTISTDHVNSHSCLVLNVWISL